jgi:CheY-like chemotaxis protein
VAEAVARRAQTLARRSAEKIAAGTTAMIGDVVQVIDSVGRLVAAVWIPVAIVLVLWRYETGIREFLNDVSEMTFEGLGLKASFKRKQAEAASALVGAAANAPNVAATQKVQNAQAAAAVVTEALTPRVVRKASNATVLWVDDLPDNNRHERQALEAIGVRFVLSTSTDDALEQVRPGRFDAIITDMGREPDQQAGYTLLERLRTSGDRTPVVIYAGSATPEQRAEARKRGALNCTNRPDELFTLVLEAIGASPRT